MSLHRVTAAAFAVLLVLSGIGTLMARQGPQPTIESVQLTDDRAEAPPAVGGQVEPEVPDEPASEETVAAAPPEPIEVVEEPFAVLTAGAQDVSTGVEPAVAPAADDDADDLDDDGDDEDDD
jgi:hypothetical protein